MYRKRIAIIALTVLTLVLSSCVSKPRREQSAIPAVDAVYFPAFPVPENIIPLDKDGKPAAADVPVEYVLIPYSYWLQIIDYVVDTETAATALQEALHPP